MPNTRAFFMTFLAVFGTICQMQIISPSSCIDPLDFVGAPKSFFISTIIMFTVSPFARSSYSSSTSSRKPSSLSMLLAAAALPALATRMFLFFF